MEELILTEVENKIYPNKQLLSHYFVSTQDTLRAHYEIRSITLGHILIAIIKNYGCIIYWGFLRLLYKAGFILIHDYEAFSWGNNFTFKFWEKK